MRYRLTTLGCRMNHAESRDLEVLLRSRGLQPAGDDPAAVEVIHTCTVTGRAAARSRQAIRRARRREHPDHPAPAVFVTGCFVGTDPAAAAEAAGLAEVDGSPAAGPPGELAGAGAVIPHDADPSGGPLAGTMVDRFAVALDAWLARPGAAGDPIIARTHASPAAPAPLLARPSASPSTSPADPPSLLPLPVLMPTHAARHTRAEIRIQDGCDAHCTFCVIPRIRRTLRSKRVADAVAEARQLVELGHVEVVLSGVFIGAYGHPTALRRRQAEPGAPYLADLLDAVAAVPGLHRLRISSMEPMDVTDELLDAMVANRGVVVPHLHLPLQSGSSRILRRMNRQYDADDYRAMLERANAALTADGLPPAITTDIICGFPGETDADFEATVQMAERAGYLHIHAFPYSPRAGTAAARWTDQAVPHPVRRARIARLIEMETRPDTGLADRFRRRLVGRELRVVVEEPDRRTGDPADERDFRRGEGWIVGRCDHHARVRVRSDAPRGSILSVLADDLEPDAIVASLSPVATVSLPQLTPPTGDRLPGHHPPPSSAPALP